MEDQPRRGYPIWAWIIGAFTIWPLIPMLIGRFVPGTRRFLGAPGVIVSTIGLLVLFGILVAVTPEPETQAIASPAPTSTPTPVQPSSHQAVTPEPETQAIASPAPTSTPTPAQPSPHQVESTDIRCNNLDTIKAMHKAIEEQEYARYYDALEQSSDCKTIFEREVIQGPFATTEVGEGAMRMTYQLHELSDGTRYWFTGGSVTPVKEGQPQHEFSPDSMTLLGLYRELEGFRYSPDFHFYCYGTGGPFNSWAENVLAIQHGEGSLTVLSDTGILAADLWELGREYCQNQGSETELSREIVGRMHPAWLAQGN